MISGTVAIVMIIAVIIGLLIQPMILLVVGLVLGGMYWEIENNPKATLEAFKQAIIDRDEDIARSLVNMDSNDMITMVFDMLEQDETNNLLEETLNEIRSIDCSLSQTNQNVSNCVICIEESMPCESLTLVKEGGRWLIAFNLVKEGGREEESEIVEDAEEVE